MPKSEQRQCQRFSNRDNNPLLCKSLLRGSLFCSSMREELLFYCAWKFHLFFLQDHKNGSPHHRADLVRQVNGTRAKRISTTFVVMRPSFKRNFKKKQRYKLHYWLRASDSPVSHALVLYFNFSSSGRFFFFAFNVHIWAPRSLCADVIEIHRDTQAAGACGLALWVMRNTCQPQRESISDSQRQLPLSLHSASFSSQCFACQLVPLHFKSTSCFIPSFSLSAGSLDSLLCFSFSSLWQNPCLACYGWMHQRGKHMCQVSFATLFFTCCTNK